MFRLSHSLHIGLFQKNPNGAEDKEFPGVLKKEHVEIPGVNIKRSRISSGLGF